MTPLLEARAITVWRGETLLLDNLHLALQAGELLQVQGANGSGKTTLLRVLAGLVPADEGDIFWRGKPVRRVRDDFHAELLYIGHRSGISGALSPVENLRLACRLSAVEAGGIESALEQLSLGERMHVACAALSAGQQRRVSLARLLLQPGRLWILDEPLTALDANGLDWVAQRLRQQVADGGSVLLTTHQPLPLSGIASRRLSLDAL